ncbi:MAG: FAD-binding protein [Deltaproteobacteria bacterium]|nr:FAD-binding protein [Deltaproteobacteria bacterium]
MKTPIQEAEKSFDVLVVGGGGAACRAAIAAAEKGAKTAMVVKGSFGKSGSTAVAMAEIIQYAAAVGSEDHPDYHFQDTVRAGMGICDERLARILADEAPERLQDLVRFGARFDFLGGKPVKQEGFAQKIPRGHAPAGRRESTILRALVKRVRTLPVEIYENTMACSLLRGPDGVEGVLALERKSGTPVLFRGRGVVLAAGGGEALYPWSPTTRDLTGDGHAMAARAGAEMVNMEFLQMGPVFLKPNNVIISGPLWRLRPKLTNKRGEKFLPQYLPSKVTEEEVFSTVEFPFTTSNRGMFVGISVQKEICAQGNPLREGVFFDLSHIPESILQERIPYTFSALKKSGVDLAGSPVEFTVSVQCFHGGARINEKGETNIKGLYAAGESAGGLRGPDRPAGNALAECQVFGERAGRFAADFAKNREGLRDRPAKEAAREAWEDLLPGPGGEKEPAGLLTRLRKLMFHEALVIKNEDGLARAESELERMEKEEIPNLSRLPQSLAKGVGVSHAIYTSLLIIRAAKRRKMSLGGYYREDFPSNLL